MPIGDQHLSAVEQRTEFMGKEFKFVVVVLSLFGTQNLKPFFNCEVRTDNECRRGEAFIGWHFATVAKCPCDEHRHHNGLAATGRHFASVTDEVWKVGFVGCIYQRSEVLIGESWGETDPFSTLTDFSEINDRLDCLALTEKKSSQKVITRPSRRSSRVTGGVSVVRFAPAFDICTECVD